MTSIDPNLLFFGNSVDSSSRLGQIEKFVEHVGSYFKRELEWLDKEGHVDLDIEFVPLFADELPPILYMSAIVATTSILEQELRGYCQALRESLALPLSFNDLSGSLLERFRRYAERLAGLNLQISEGEWQDIRAVYEIRNCLVHNGGFLDGFGRADMVRAFSSRHGHPELTEGRLELSLPSVQMIGDMVSSFLDNTYNAALIRFPGRYGPYRPLSE